jgi:hypothetical protein
VVWSGELGVGNSVSSLSPNVSRGSSDTVLSLDLKSRCKVMMEGLEHDVTMHKCLGPVLFLWASSLSDVLTLVVYLFIIHISLFADEVRLFR